jgi:hypothetical protein
LLPTKPLRSRPREVSGQEEGKESKDQETTGEHKSYFDAPFHTGGKIQQRLPQLLSAWPLPELPEVCTSYFRLMTSKGKNMKNGKRKRKICEKRTKGRRSARKSLILTGSIAQFIPHSS